MTSPSVSVVMSVYNNVHDLPRSMGSVLRQSYADFEVVAVNDGSTDGSGELLDRIAAGDPRVRVLHQANAGLGPALQRACAEARGALLARQDADDESVPGRLARQVAYMGARPAVAVCGTWAWMVHPEHGAVAAWEVPDDDALLRRLLEAGSNPIVHGSVMMRRDTYVREGRGGYRLRSYCEDLDLWLRLSAVGELGTLESHDYVYGLNAQGMTVSKLDSQQRFAALCLRLHAERRDQGGEVTDWRAEEATLIAQTDAPVSPEARAATVAYAGAMASLRAGRWRPFARQLAEAARGSGPLATRARLMVPFTWAAPALRAAQRLKQRGTAWQYVRSLPPGFVMPAAAQPDA